jgi:hypothetical protein
MEDRERARRGKENSPVRGQWKGMNGGKDEVRGDEMY